MDEVLFNETSEKNRMLMELYTSVSHYVDTIFKISLHGLDLSATSNDESPSLALRHRNTTSTNQYSTRFLIDDFKPVVHTNYQHVD
jgi:hypothetical protein